ncbi:protein of unknown function [Streptomyces sp. KY75]|nr:protein of unknown function [Streptomyces sp. KY70]CAD5987455.1 protein of unknown function [Streptomyces sp. KY75]
MSAGSRLRGYGTGGGTHAPYGQVNQMVTDRTQRVCRAVTSGTEGTTTQAATRTVPYRIIS